MCWSELLSAPLKRLMKQRPLITALLSWALNLRQQNQRPRSPAAAGRGAHFSGSHITSWRVKAPCQKKILFTKRQIGLELLKRNILLKGCKITHCMFQAWKVIEILTTLLCSLSSIKENILIKSMNHYMNQQYSRICIYNYNFFFTNSFSKNSTVLYSTVQPCTVGIEMI